MAIKSKTSFTLSTEALELLTKLSKHFGIPKTNVLELVIREKARSEGVISSQN